MQLSFPETASWRCVKCRSLPGLEVRDDFGRVGHGVSRRLDTLNVGWAADRIAGGNVVVRGWSLGRRQGYPTLYMGAKSAYCECYQRPGPHSLTWMKQLLLLRRQRRIARATCNLLVEDKVSVAMLGLP